VRRFKAIDPNGCYFLVHKRGTAGKSATGLYFDGFYG
jgi:hypothetical protein